MLSEKGTPTIAAVRQLYRQLAIRLHPDTRGSSGEAFIELQKEYEAAIEQLRRAPRARTVKIEPRPAARISPREAFLRAMYRHAVAFGSRGWQTGVQHLLESANRYDRIVGQTMTDYSKTFLSTYGTWSKDRFIKQTHEKCLVLVKQLASYYDDRNELKKKLLESVLEEVLERSKRLDSCMGQVVARLCELIRSEETGRKVPMSSL